MENKSKKSKENRRLRVAGKPYDTSKGKNVPQKQPPNTQTICKCRFKCATLSAEHKELLFHQYYNLNEETKGTYLLNHMEIIPVKRRRHGKYEDSAESRRQCTLCYTVPSGSGEHVQVCLKTFKDIFGLTARRVQTLSTKKKAGDLTYVDKRGKNPTSQLHRKKFTDDHKSSVILHISGFPSEESHYGRSKSSKQYLSPDLNIHRMYLHFKALNTNSPVTYKYYKNVFKSDSISIFFRRNAWYLHLCRNVLF